MKKTSWVLIGFLSRLIGLYPMIYFLVDRQFGLLNSKSTDLLNDNLWNVAFYAHIILGGLALLIGWMQFSDKLKKRKVHVHRIIGKIYDL